MGIGTDIGGSLRIPAIYNQMVSFKSTESRITNKGVFNATPYNFKSNLNIVTVVGAITNNTQDLIHFH